MIKKSIKLGEDSRQATKNVSEYVRDIVGKTMGPAGRNYNTTTGITNDGKTVMSQIRFDDECEDQVAIAYHEIARQQFKDSGDNTSTAIVLGASVYLDNVEDVGDMDIPMPNSITAMELLNELDEEKDKAVELLNKKKVEVKSQKDLEKVAFTAMENKRGAEIVSKVVYEAGKDTLPIVEYGADNKITTEIIKGLSLKMKLDNSKTVKNKLNRAEYDDAVVLVANHLFEDVNEIAPFFASVFTKDKPQKALVIVGRQFSIPFTNYITKFTEKTKFPIVLVSQEKFQEEFEDIASFCDAKLIDTHPRTGNMMIKTTIVDVGFVKKVIARDDNVQFIGGRGLDLKEIKDEKMVTRVSKRVEEIKDTQSKKKDEKERLVMDKRISALLGGITTIYVGAKTIVDKYYLKLKTENAVNSCIKALEGGMVKGGGMSYKEVADALGAKSRLYKALNYPYERMKKNNMGKELDVEGIYDSYSSMKSAIENAVSVSKVILSQEGIIADKEQSMVEELGKVTKEE